jgi:hypothetical protein
MNEKVAITLLLNDLTLVSIAELLFWKQWKHKPGPPNKKRLVKTELQNHVNMPATIFNYKTTKLRNILYQQRIRRINRTSLPRPQELYGPYKQ